ncbi:MAG: PfkB family carbohydrate kinase [Treponema sp.]|nr:PfkB family carbohydrate kinase [Treponema sp.]MCL2250461.1 PfkB family carbohydrate kinase [Treponema sp.]
MFLTVCLNPTIQKTLRFSSVIPGTVNRTGIHRLDVSGKGINVTRVLTQLGKKVLHLTQLGGDLRPLFLSLCKQDGLNVEWVESDSQIRFCYTIINESDGSVTEYVEESEAVDEGTEERLLKEFDSVLYGAADLKFLIISGTKAAGFSDAVIPTMVKKAKEKGLKVILDIKGNDLIESLKYQPDVIKPNLFEFASVFAPELIKDNDLINENINIKERIKSIVLEMTHKNKCCIILTNGSKKIYAAKEDNFFEVDVQPIRAVNSIGCGDAFTAGFTATLETGANFKNAIEEGMRCGSLNASFEKPGVIS